MHNASGDFRLQLTGVARFFRWKYLTIFQFLLVVMSVSLTESYLTYLPFVADLVCLKDFWQILIFPVAATRDCALRLSWVCASPFCVFLPIDRSTCTGTLGTVRLANLDFCLLVWRTLLFEIANSGPSCLIRRSLAFLINGWRHSPTLTLLLGSFSKQDFNKSTSGSLRCKSEYCTSQLAIIPKRIRGTVCRRAVCPRQKYTNRHRLPTCPFCV